jgi:glycerol-3-phosphate acyltransferase PlsY
LGCVIVFAIIVLLTKYVSLGSILGAMAFPIQLTFNLWNNNANTYEIIFAWLIFLILAVMHRQNIQKLLKGTENKIGTKK